MIELASTPEDIKIKDFFEAPWMHKYRGNYYFSYASGYPSTTNYSMAPSINGPWTQKGVINDKMENSETNHQAIFKYLGHWYFMYHGANSPGGWTYRRSVNIDYLYRIAIWHSKTRTASWCSALLLILPRPNCG